MTVGIAWQRGISLGTKSTFKKNIAQFKLSECPESPGIYIFARKFDDVLEPIYIGKATNLRSRLKTQFNNYRLMEALANEKSGDRVLLLGTIKSSAPDAIRKKIRIAERTHIEHALTAGYPLINVQLTKGAVDMVHVEGKKAHSHPFPRVMFAKAQKGRS
jgi:hypothetical protein